MTSRRWVRWPATTASPRSSSGSATAVTTDITSIMRTSSRSNCSNWIFRRLLRRAASRYSIAAQVISRCLRRLHKWISTGAAAAASHPSMAGLAMSKASGRVSMAKQFRMSGVVDCVLDESCAFLMKR